MKIGFISYFLPEKDGIAIYSKRLVGELKKLGIEVVTIGTRASNADYKLNFKSLFLKGNLVKIIKREKLDILHIVYIAPWFGKYNLNLNLLRVLRLKIPIVTQLEEVQYKQKGDLFFKFKVKLLQWLERKIIQLSTKVICDTLNQKKYLEYKSGCKNIHNVYLGVDLLKKNQRKGKNILFFGMITPKKGVHILLKAMPYLEEYNLQIAGGVPADVNQEYGNKIIRLVKEINKEKKIISLDMGWISENKKKQYYKNADIVVLPYLWAPYMSGVVPEAVSYGLPCVVSNIGSVWETTAEFKSGVLVKPGDVNSLVKGIREVFDNYKDYKSGINKYRAKANWTVTSKNIFKIYKSILI